VVVNTHGHALRLSLMADAAALRGACAALRARGDDGDCVPAWRLGAHAPPRAESALQQLLLLSHALAALVEDVHGSRGVVATLRRQLSSPELAHVAGVTASAAALQAFLSRATATLAHMRLGAGGPYLETSAAVVDEIVAIVDATVAGNMRRIASFGGTVGRRPAWRSTFIEHAVTAGAMPAALQPTYGA
jgi:predicted RNA-binding Zn ribbon-like protein